MQTVLIATDKPFAKVAVNGISEIIKNAGFELKLLEKYTTKEQLLEAVKDVDAVIVRSDIIDEEVIKAAGKLKIAVRAGAGYDKRWEYMHMDILAGLWQESPKDLAWMSSLTILS